MAQNHQRNFRWPERTTMPAQIARLRRPHHSRAGDQQPDDSVS
jgi:hypothetical protein